MAEKSSKDVIIVGASGFGRQLALHVLEVGDQHPEVRLKGFLDDDPKVKAELDNVLDIEVIGDTRSYAIQKNDRLLICFGDPELRKQISKRLAERGAKFFTLIHPTSYVARTAIIGAGCIIGPFANVGADARLGEHVLLNMYATAGHDTKIGSFTVISPYGTASGGSLIGERVFLGSHAVVTPNKQVGHQSRIAAAAVVYRDVPELSLATGNPAKTFSLSQPTENNDARTTVQP